MERINLECLVVEIHFVGDYSNAPVKLPSLTTDQLRYFIENLAKNYEPISSNELIGFFRGLNDLPSKSFHLTFDDGIKDHITNVLPLLSELGLTASFFIPGSIFDKDKTLPFLERQRFLQYAFEDYDTFLDEFTKAVVETNQKISFQEIEISKANLKSMGDYLSQYKFYSQNERYYRYIRDKILNLEQFEGAINKLFKQVFSNEKEIFDTYYVSSNDVKTLFDAGMNIGGHGHAHEHLPRLTDQIADIKKGLSTLQEITGVVPNTFCYPYGSYDETTLSVMAELNIQCAFTTQNKVAYLDSKEPYSINRIDIAELIK